MSYRDVRARGHGLMSAQGHRCHRCPVARTRSWLTGVPRRRCLGGRAWTLRCGAIVVPNPAPGERYPTAQVTVLLGTQRATLLGTQQGCVPRSWVGPVGCVPD